MFHFVKEFWLQPTMNFLTTVTVTKSKVGNCKARNFLAGANI